MVALLVGDQAADNGYPETQYRLASGGVSGSPGDLSIVQTDVDDTQRIASQTECIVGRLYR